MVSRERLLGWRQQELITEEQLTRLSEEISGSRISLFGELNTLLYLGVLAFVAGLGLTIQRHFARLGDIAIFCALGAIIGASAIYCARKAAPFSRSKVPSPTFAFDYIVYLGCLAYGVGLSFLEIRYDLAGPYWHHYLLVSAGLFFLLAYRFDNRLVLSMALGTLATWFGLRLSMRGLNLPQLRGTAIAFGLIVIALGAASSAKNLKRHFLSTYVTLGSHMVLAALVWGIGNAPFHVLYLLALAAACGLALAWARKTSSVLYGCFALLYFYVGASVEAVHVMSYLNAPVAAFLLYFLTASGVAFWSVRLLGKWLRAP